MTPWTVFSVLNPPAHWEVQPSGVLDLTTAEGSDFWRETQYGFVRDNGHAFLTDAPTEFTASVTMRGEYEALYDQAGLMLRADEASWMKAGVEYVQAQRWSVVVTRQRSDWSMMPASDHPEMTFRLIRRGDALILHARPDPDAAWTLLRVADFPVGLPAQVGVMACSPERAGFRASFREWSLTPPDRRPLHDLTRP